MSALWIQTIFACCEIAEVASARKPLRMTKDISRRHQDRRLARRLSGSSPFPLEGAAAADYMVTVTIGSESFEVIVDTGSSSFAVAAAPTSAGCAHYYTGICSGAAIEADYGTSQNPTSWSGRVCAGAAVLLGDESAGISAGEPEFAGILQQTNWFSGR